MFNPWPIAFNDLKQNRVGAGAVIALIALAVALGVAVSAQERALRQGSAEAADAFDILIGAPGSETQLLLTSIYLQPTSLDLLDPQILADLSENEDAAFAAPLGFGDSWTGHQIIGTIDDFVDQLAGGNLAAGVSFTKVGEAVIGTDVPLQVGEDFIPAHGQIVLDEEDEQHGGVAYRVVGQLPRLGTPWDRAILVPIENVWATHGLPTGHRPSDAEIERLLGTPATDDGTIEAAGDRPDDAGSHDSALPESLGASPLGPPWDRASLSGVPAIVVKPASLAAAYQLRQRYRADDRSMAVFPAEVLIQLYSVLGDVRDLLAWISILTQVLVIGAVLLAIMATMGQKRRLVGVLRALGASRAFVFTVAWINVSLLIAAGAGLGLLFGWAGSLGLSALLEARTAMHLPVSLTAQEVGLVGILILIGLVLALVPSVMLYRQPVAAALRG